ncbi:MAG: exodeoxyribonuclease VII large subunit [Acidobacteria bacterium]|nr:exodeoxyribonuclease VII large subunit [Acidobacteriota bacterium]
MADSWGLPFDDVPEVAKAPPVPEPPLSVGDLTARLKSLVESGFSRVEVEGQVSGHRPHSSGHLYFTLKDDRSQIRAVMFRTDARKLTFRLEDGQHIVARGRVSVYEVRGEYQIICDRLEPHGQGALQLAFEQLKRRLAADGLFDVARKRPLPVLPRKIGVVTSRSGAALQDILRVLIARYPSAHVVVRDARVQGDGSGEDLVRALRAITGVAGVDVVIIGRGGGSAEDLWAFNHEGLARAIAASPVPVISAVGHEVDFTIADFVADLRAATPSNAAELVVERADSFQHRIDRAAERLAAATRRALDGRRQRVMRTASRLDGYPTRIVLQQRDIQESILRLRHAQATRIGRARQMFERLRRRLEARDVRRVTADWQLRLAKVDSHLGQTARAGVQHASARSRELAARLHALSPLAVLGRGYAVCWDDTRTSIIRSAASVSPGEAVRVIVADGELRCTVTERTDS